MRGNNSKNLLSIWSIVVILALVALSLGVGSVRAGQMGWYTVAYEDSKCVFLSNNMGFTLVELYSGVPIKGMAVLGPVNTYGVHEFYDEKGNVIFSGYLDDWGLSEQRAIEKINQKCRPR